MLIFLSFKSVLCVLVLSFESVPVLSSESDDEEDSTSSVIRRSSLEDEIVLVVEEGMILEGDIIVLMS